MGDKLSTLKGLLNNLHAPFVDLVPSMKASSIGSSYRESHKWYVVSCDGVLVCGVSETQEHCKGVTKLTKARAYEIRANFGETCQ